MAYLVDAKEIRSSANYPTLLIDNGDIVLDNGGKMVMVSWLEKLAQSIERELSIAYSAETGHGNQAFSTLQELTEQSDYALNRIRNDFLAALLRLQARQTSLTPPAESLSKIVAVIATFDEEDPTTVIVGVAAINALKQPVEATYSVNPDTLSIKLVN